VRYPLSLRNVEDLLFERGIDICHETVRLWWNRFGPMFAAEIRKKRVDRMRGNTHWRWHLDEVYVKINGEMRYLWRPVDHGQLAYAASTCICTAVSLSQEVDLALGAQAGPTRLAKVLKEGGFGRMRRVAETSNNIVLEARP
jgi:hypothetical protein